MDGDGAFCVFICGDMIRTNNVMPTCEVYKQRLATFVSLLRLLFIPFIPDVYPGNLGHDKNNVGQFFFVLLLQIISFCGRTSLSISCVRPCNQLYIYICTNIYRYMHSG